ncbi:hypothetical protein [Saccharopolyspora sp. ASAGF58]|nr:hypothetical protein [Saccharopolyspora sp. ASAGF58]
MALQGHYTLQPGDRQSFRLPDYATQVSIAYQGDTEIYVSFEFDTQWK